MIYLLSPERKQYKANLHCHSILSDGRKTPEELKEMYRRHGYSVLAITDHERPVCHKSLSEEDFILLTGYEAYVRPDNDGKAPPYKQEVHLNLFARDPDNVDLIYFDDRFSRYVKRDNALDTFGRVGEENVRDFSVEFINKFIALARENGYLVSYNHPYWSMDSEERILSYRGLFSLEIFNYSSYCINCLETNAPLYDRMLESGMRLFCHAADDNHNAREEGDPGCDSFGAFTMILPQEFSYDGIYRAMETGDMYASMGPTIDEISLDGNTLHVKCSPCAHILAYYGSKNPSALHAPVGETVTEATFTIREDAHYIRVGVLDREGKWANSRAYFPEEFASR